MSPLDLSFPPMSIVVHRKILFCAYCTYACRIADGVILRTTDYKQIVYNVIFVDVRYTAYKYDVIVSYIYTYLREIGVLFRRTKSGRPEFKILNQINPVTGKFGGLGEVRVHIYIYIRICTRGNGSRWIQFDEKTSLIRTLSEYVPVYICRRDKRSEHSSNSTQTRKLYFVPPILCETVRRFVCNS